MKETLRLFLATFLFFASGGLTSADVIITADSATAFSAGSAFGSPASQTSPQSGGGMAPNLSVTSSINVASGDATAQNSSFANLTLTAPVAGTQHIVANVGTAGSSSSGNTFGDPSSSNGSGQLSGTFHLDSAFQYVFSGSGTAGSSFSIDGVGSGTGPFASGSSGILGAGDYNFTAFASGSSVNNSGAYDSNLSFDLALTSAVPEPATITLVGIALLLGVGHGWRRRSKAVRAQ